MPKVKYRQAQRYPHVPIMLPGITSMPGCLLVSKVSATSMAKPKFVRLDPQGSTESSLSVTSHDKNPTISIQN